MEMVLFIGIQATGKSAYYSEKFYRTHVRINGDMLKTRHREDLLIRACLEGKTPFVVDKMNLTRADRAAYIGLAKTAGFKISGYFFESDLAAALVGIHLNGFLRGESGPLARRSNHQLPAKDSTSCLPCEWMGGVGSR